MGGISVWPGGTCLLPSHTTGVKVNMAAIVSSLPDIARCIIDPHFFVKRQA